MSMSQWAEELGLTAPEVTLLSRVVEAEDCTAERWARKTIWQALRLNLPRSECERTPLYPPGFSG
jgi:hypothetical protein